MQTRLLLRLNNSAPKAFENGEALMEQADLPEDACLVLDYRLPGIDGLTLLA
jgi:FixJ family two-component response regulator